MPAERASETPEEEGASEIPNGRASETPGAVREPEAQSR